MKGSRLSRCLHALWQYLTQAGLVLLILVALYVGLGRQFIRVLLLHPERMESFLALQMGCQVQVGKAEGTWQGVEPTLRLFKVALALPGEQPFLTLPELVIRPELGASLWHREARFALILQHLHLHMHQDAEGHWSVDELVKFPVSDVNHRKAMIKMLGNQPRLELDDVLLDIFPKQGKFVQVTGLRVRVAGWGQRHTLLADGEVRQNRHDLGSLHVAVNMQGALNGWNHAKIHAYLQIPRVRLEDFLPDFLSGWKISLIHGVWQMWVDQSPATGRQVTLLAQGVHVESKHEDRLLEITWPQVLMSWQGTASNYRLSIQNVQALLNKHPIQMGPIAILHKDSQWRIATGAWDLAMPELVVQSTLDASNNVRLAMTELHLHGKLRHGIFDFKQTDSGLQTQYVEAMIEDAGWQPWQQVPGISHLDMEIQGSNQSGRIYLHHDRTEGWVPQYLDQPIKWQHLSAQGGWQHDADGILTITLADLQASNDDAHIQAALNLRMEAIPYLSLMASMEQGQAAATWRYTPRQAVGSSTVAWLKTALQSGQVVRGDALYEGKVGDAIDALQLNLKLQHVWLNYQPGWPSLKDVEAQISLSQGQLHLDQGQAQLWGTTLTGVQADLDTRPVSMSLVLGGGVQGQAMDVLRLFRESPLVDTLGKVVSGWTLTGPIHGQLNLKIPMDARPVQVNVQAELPGNDMHVREPALTFSRVHGQLHYDTSDGLSGSLQAQFMQHPADVSLVSHMDQGQLQTLQVQAQAEASLDALAARWPGFWWSRISGDIPFGLKLAIHPASHQTDTLELSSTLHGMQSRLPPPLDKASTQDLPISLVASQGDTDTLAHLRVGSRLGAAMVFKQGQLQRAEIRLGSVDQGWPTLPGIAVQGRLESLDLDRWQKIVTGAHSGSGLPALRLAQLDIQSMNVMGYRLQHVRLRAEHPRDRWHVSMYSDSLSGNAMIPDHPSDQDPDQIHVANLFWPLEASDHAVSISNTAHWQPTLLDVDALHLNGYPDSKVHGRLHAEGLSVFMKELRWSLPGLTMQGELVWQPGQLTRWDATLDSDDLSQVFALFDSVPTLDAEKAHADLHMHWPGDPWQFTLLQAEGEGQIKLSKGRILAVSRTASVSRVIGLFNFADIGRRLKLDFSDLTEKGVAFDSFVLQGNLQAAKLHLQNFELLGPALTAEGQGTLDLSTHNLDVAMGVTVPVTRVFPLALAFVAGPLVGGAALAAQAMLSHPLAKLTTVNYHLSGNWEDPDVKLIGGGGLRLPFRHIPQVLPVQPL